MKDGSNKLVFTSGRGDSSRCKEKGAVMPQDRGIAGWALEALR